jgi:hypothetical protein
MMVYSTEDTYLPARRCGHVAWAFKGKPRRLRVIRNGRVFMWG